VGENRDQEAAAKVAELGRAADEPAAGLRWHFIGALQTNKCASVARYAHLVHSIDRLRLVSALSAAAVRAQRPIDCLVQLNLDLERRAERAGAQPDDVLPLAGAIADAPGLTLRGVMGIAPLGGDPARAFAALGEVAAQVREAHPAAAVISAGMSGDFEVAIAHGATHLRVGAALLGSRPQPR
jgi:pyridoxal phosphate enzyme (YggS family)